MRRFLVPALLSTILALSACNLFGSSGSGGDSSSSSSSEESVITRNVSYTGILEELDVSIYGNQQGTHKLTLDNGDFLLVESTDANLDLDAYMGKTVEIRGSVQPTVEAGGLIFRAEEVTVLDEETSSSSSVASSLMDSSSSSAVSSVAPPPPPSSRAASSAMSVAASSVASSAPTGPSAAMEQQIVLMAKQSYDASLWTQKYCTSHIAFCVPAHKNWYYKSFGATTSNLWHVEFGMTDIEQIGQGPIILNLVSGSSASMQAQDGQVKTQGSEVIGFKDWTDNTHFEIIADARLQAAVQYMLDNITPYAPAQ